MSNMKVTNDQIFAAHRLLSQIKINTLDKDIRIDVLKNAIELSSLCSSINEKINSAKEKIFSGLDNDIEQINQLREELDSPETTDLRKNEIIKIINTYNEYLSAEKDFLLFLNKIGTDTVDVNIVTIDSEKLIDILLNNNIELSLGQINSIAFLFS